MPDYAAWISAQRAAAIARGGKPLRNLPGADEYEFPRATNRKQGEIINPLTGEIVTGCLTISKFADQLRLSAQALADVLEEAGAVVRVLRADEVPMICDPCQTKPRYYHTPAVTREGVEDGLVIPISVSHRGKRVPCILITPQGQEKVRQQLRGEAPQKLGKVAVKQEMIGRLLEAGYSQASIARETGLPKQTVSRIAKGRMTSTDAVPF